MMSEAKDTVFYKNSLTENIILSVISLVVIVANSFEIAHIYKKKSKNSYEVLLISLSVSDAFFGLTNLVFMLIQLVSGHIFVTVIRSFYMFFFLLSVIHLITLALDRWVAVTFPLKHKIYWEIRHAKKLIAFLWILVALISVMIFFDLNQHIAETGVRPWVIPVVSTIIIATDATLVILYSLVFYQISKQERNKARINQSSDKKTQQRKLKSAFLLCVLTTLTFILCTLRFTIQLVGDTSKWPDVYSSMLIVTNSFWNSFIYFFHGKISQLLKKKTVRTSKQESN